MLGRAIIHKANDLEQVNNLLLETRIAGVLGFLKILLKPITNG